MKLLVFAMMPLLLSTLGVLTVQAAEENPMSVMISSGRGAIRFPHVMHLDRVKGCEICHHRGVEAGPCRGCHGLVAEAPNARDAFHRLCNGCHRQKGGPTLCSGCHIKTPDSSGDQPGETGGGDTTR